MPEISSERRRTHLQLLFRLAANTATQSCRRLMSRIPSGRHAGLGSEAGLPAPWKLATETLVFRFGPWTLAERNFQSLSNMTNPLTAESGSLKMPPIFQPTTYRQMRDDGTIPRNVGFDRNAIRYVSHRGRRYYIDLSSGAFDEYFAKFAAKTRNTLKRKLRHFAERSGGTVDFRVYSSPDEIIEFRRQALTVSLVSYQRKIGFGLPETEDFLTSLVEQATNRKVYGFLLMANEKAVAYVYCPIDQDILVYSYCGYDPEFAQSSPGTALLFLIIRWSFQQKKFRMFDLGNDSWDYKAMFATGAVKYLKVMWFPKRLSYFVIIILHMLVLRAWSGAASLKETSTSWAQRLRSEGMRFTSSHRTDPKADGADTLRRPRKRE